MKFERGCEPVELTDYELKLIRKAHSVSLATYADMVNASVEMVIRGPRYCAQMQFEMSRIIVRAGQVVPPEYDSPTKWGGGLSSMLLERAVLTRVDLDLCREVAPYTSLSFEGFREHLSEMYALNNGEFVEPLREGMQRVINLAGGTPRNEADAEVERERCGGCGEEIDASVCWCGDSIDHNYDGHSSVPMGCRCGFDKGDCAEPPQ